MVHFLIIGIIYVYVEVMTIMDMEVEKIKREIGEV